MPHSDGSARNHVSPLGCAAGCFAAKTLLTGSKFGKAIWQQTRRRCSSWRRFDLDDQKNSRKQSIMDRRTRLHAVQAAPETQELCLLRSHRCQLRRHRLHPPGHAASPVCDALQG